MLGPNVYEVLGSLVKLHNSFHVLTKCFWIDQMMTL